MALPEINSLQIPGAGFITRTRVGFQPQAEATLHYRIGLSQMDRISSVKNEILCLQPIRRVLPSIPNIQVLNQVVRMYQDDYTYWRFNKPHGNWKQLMDDLRQKKGDLQLYVLEDSNGRVVGTYSLQKQSPTEIESLRHVILPEYQQRGLGKTLTRDMLYRIFERNKYQKVTAKTAKTKNWEIVYKLCHEAGFEDTKITHKPKDFGVIAVYEGNWFTEIGAESPLVGQIVDMGSSNLMNTPYGIGLELVEYTDGQGEASQLTYFHEYIADVEVITMELTREKYRSKARRIA